MVKKHDEIRKKQENMQNSRYYNPIFDFRWVCFKLLSDNMVIWFTNALCFIVDFKMS